MKLAFAYVTTIAAFLFVGIYFSSIQPPQPLSNALGGVGLFLAAAVGVLGIFDAIRRNP